MDNQTIQRCGDEVHQALRGQDLPAGSMVMTGGVTKAIAVKAGDSVTVRVQGLGAMSMRFV